MGEWEGLEERLGRCGGGGTVDGYRANGKGALGKWVGIKKGGANGLRAMVRERGQQMRAEPMGKELWVSGWG